MPNFISAFLLMYSLHLQDPSGFWLKSQETEKNIIYLKSKYISKTGPKITIWVKFADKVPEEIDGGKKTYLLILKECNCNNYSFKNLVINSYYENGEAQNVNNVKDPELSYSVPGSIGYGLIDDICTRFNKKKK